MNDNKSVWKVRIGSNEEKPLAVTKPSFSPELDVPWIINQLHILIKLRD